MNSLNTNDFYVRKVYNEYLCWSKSGMLYKKEWYSGNTTFLRNNNQSGLIKNWEGQGQKY